MSLAKWGVSRRSLTIAVAATAAVISLGLGAHAALNKISNDAREIVSSIGGDAVGSAQVARPSRIALVIGNSKYPDANAPLSVTINDARSMTVALRADGFEVDVIEDANKEDMRHAVDRLKTKVQKDSVVMLFFGGYGMQAGKESYMIPVDAAIWREADVRREGVSIESVLDALKERGARANLVVLDSSRRNPYERRFRTYSRGMAAIDAPQNTLILSSSTPGKVIDEPKTENSVMVSELLKSMKTDGSGAEQIFNRARIAVTKSSDGQQVPTVSSSLIEDVRFGGGKTKS